MCQNLAFQGDYTPVLAKHTKKFGLKDSHSIGVDRMQRNFEPMRRQVESWRTKQLSDDAAKLIIYRGFSEGDLEVPKHLARVVHSHYFDPRHEEFAPRTMWSLSNAFTSAFKELEAISQFRATAKLGAFLEGVQAVRAGPKALSREGSANRKRNFPPVVLSAAADDCCEVQSRPGGAM